MKQKNSYLIKSTMEICPDSDECLYWHTCDGWVDKSSATKYCDKDLEWISLPAESFIIDAATNEKIDL